MNLQNVVLSKQKGISPIDHDFYEVQAPKVFQQHFEHAVRILRRAKDTPP